MKIDEVIDAYFRFQEAAYTAEQLADIEVMGERTLPDDFLVVE